MIELQNFNKSFKNKLIFESINIQFKSNTFYGIYGPSGSGKTTLLNLISMLDSSYEGNIYINNQNLKEIKKKQDFRKSTFSFIFSESSLLDYLTVKENILLPLTFLKKNIPSDFEELAKELSIKELLNRDISTLSEGEKQRVSILRALMSGQQIIICDEPTSHLDKENSILIVKTLSKLAKEKEKTVIMSCHDQTLIEYFDKAYEIKEYHLNEIKTESKDNL